MAIISEEARYNRHAWAIQDYEQEEGEVFQTPLPVTMVCMDAANAPRQQALDKRLQQFEEHCTAQLNGAYKTLTSEMASEFAQQESHLLLMQDQLNKAHAQHAQQLGDMYRRLERSEVRASQHASLLREHRDGSLHQVQALATELARLRREVHLLSLPWPARLLHAMQWTFSCCKAIHQPVALPAVHNALPSAGSAAGLPASVQLIQAGYTAPCTATAVKETHMCQSGVNQEQHRQDQAGNLPLLGEVTIAIPAGKEESQVVSSGLECTGKTVFGLGPSHQPEHEGQVGLA